MMIKSYSRKISIIIGSVIIIPILLSYNIKRTISYDELIGKGNPELFGEGYSLREEAKKAFLKMKSAAAESGIDIKVVSSYRNYAHQNRIWERKYRKFTKDGMSPIDAIKKIVEYSTIPGTSRHHWGTDIDIVDDAVKQPKNLLAADHFHDDGPFCKLKEWLDEHSETYGFYLVYTDNANRNGFKYEPWHLSYKALSIDYLAEYKKLDLLEMLQKEQLLGSEYFTKEFLESYISDNILDINPALLP
ncbi:MAG: M15 family metallopeptidase [Bacteroidia bacterium]|nr:M15 family metallopeptidase [Bacteroidia bacterium]MBT8309569.1 M15 family metallopeptidase [Bacteroidia bacterium]NND10151.1 M15 family metallopeptidase [Flavobacteriaceae bacterium]NNL61996.1 M15 family metallopeptidase [Flavobacteriaceae bacterium]